MMPAVRTIGILCFALAAGCAAVKESPPSAMGQTGPLIVDPSLVGPKRSGPIEPERGGPVAPERPRSEAKEEGTVTQKQ
jgi:hypothetical protein